MTTSQTRRLSVVLTTPADRPICEQLWTMFRHDMSAFSGALPDAGGRFRQERLDAAFAQDGWAAYLVRLGAAPVGLSVVRGLSDTERVISSFFLVHGARRAGCGRAAVHDITRRHPGRWAVAFQDVNSSAAAFWRSIAAEVDPDWTFEHRGVPARKDLPPDSWVRFVVRRPVG